MKTNQALLRILIAAFCALAFPIKAGAQISADFNAGNTSTLVDGYTGMAGNGWLGPWTLTSWTGGLSFSNSVVTTSPLGGGGNYLGALLTVTGGDPGVYWGMVGRKFDTAVVSSTAAYSLSFLIRSDTAWGSNNDALNILGSTAPGYVTNPTSLFDTYYIMGHYNSGSPTWRVCDGDTAGNSTDVETGMSLTAGTVYSFVVNVDPYNQSYTVAIYDGVTLYNSPVLGFRNSGFDGGNTFYFVSNVMNTTHSMGYSVDSIGVDVGFGGPLEVITNLTDVPWVDPGPDPNLNVAPNSDEAIPMDDAPPVQGGPVNDDTTIQDG